MSNQVFHAFPNLEDFDFDFIYNMLELLSDITCALNEI